MIKIDRIEDAIDDIRNGKVIVVVDDEDRENEGDFICAAECITPEIVNFMATHGRGLICAPLVEDRCEELGLELMVGKNTATFETPFTVSVDLIGHGCTTGISAHDRFKTIKALVDPEIKPDELGRPGHIFPLKQKQRRASPHRSYRSSDRLRKARGLSSRRSSRGDHERRRIYGATGRPSQGGRP